MTARQKLPVLKIILALFRRYLLPGVGLPILLINQSLAVPIEHGAIAVTDSSRTLNAVATPGVSLGGEINRGDYAVDVDPKGLNNDGVMIASVAENQRNGRYPTVSVFPDEPLERSWIGVCYPSTNSNDEWDCNVALAFFSDDDFDWAIAGTGDLINNGEVITAANLRSSSSVTFGTHFFYNANGT